MAKQNALGLYLPDEDTLDKLKETYASMIDKVVEALSQKIKNTDISGDPEGGNVEVRRPTNAASQDLGTAREAGFGDKVANNVVNLLIDTDREIIEEVKAKDLRLHPMESIIAVRSLKHSEAMIRELDTAFFTEAISAGTELTFVSNSIEEQVEELLVKLETVSNDYVDGVDRENMVLTVRPGVYAALRNYIDTLPNPVKGGVNAALFHDVEIYSNRRQTKDLLVQMKGAVAQQVVAWPYAPEKINLSNDYAVELFYSYGTKAVADDLIFYADTTLDIVPSA